MDWLLLDRNAGMYVAKILPVAQPTTYELVINLKTAKALKPDPHRSCSGPTG